MSTSDEVQLEEGDTLGEIIPLAPERIAEMEIESASLLPPDEIIAAELSAGETALAEIKAAYPALSDATQRRMAGLPPLPA
jgi:hypothetical protein